MQAHNCTQHFAYTSIFFWEAKKTKRTYKNGKKSRVGDDFYGERTVVGVRGSRAG